MAMKREDYLAWFEDLLKRFESIKRYPLSNYSTSTYWYEGTGAHAWATEAEAALAAVFPPADANRQSWERLLQGLRPGAPHGGTLEGMLGVLQGAARQIRDGRIGNLINTVRVETEDELLDQAQTLLNAKPTPLLVAATVIAGGALETHLRHLVSKHGLTVNGDGSINTYDGAIAQARNTGTITVYVQTDSKLVTAWGGMRHDAAHTPGTFSRSADDVRRMIEGIREFISRTS
jgi:hypothetical protein